MSDLCFLSAVNRRALGYLISNAVDFLGEKIESLPPLYVFSIMSWSVS